MKASRKLIPAFAMLLIAAVMMSTASYAWFITNGQVTATGMTVTAKANTTYLQITSIEGSWDAGIENNRTETVSISKQLYPVVYKPLTEDDDPNWYTAVGTTFENGAATGNAYEPVSIGTDFVLQQDFWVKVVENYDAAKDFRLSTVTVAGTSQAASVVVMSGDRVNYTKVASDNTHEVVAEEDLIDLVGTDAVKITVYVYINGDHPDVTNKKLEAGNVLKDLVVTLTFTSGNETLGG